MLRTMLSTQPMEVHEFRHIMRQRYALSWHGGMMVGVVSFSTRGLPRTADLVFDAGFCAIHYDPTLRPLTGRGSSPFICRNRSAFSEFVNNIQRLISDLLPRYRQEGRVTINVGGWMYRWSPSLCNGSRTLGYMDHRSRVGAFAASESIAPVCRRP